MRDDAIPTRNPTFNVLEMALLKFGSARTLLNVESVTQDSEIKLSTRRIANGYRIKTVRKAIRRMMVVTMIGSPNSFFLSRLAL